MSRLARFSRYFATIPLAVVISAVLGGPASAHVKWFCAFNVAGQPVGLENVLCPDFEFLIGLSILGLMLGCLLEGTAVGPLALRSLDRVTNSLYENTETVFRVGTIFFFISVWAVGGFILTPELKANSNVIAAIQLGIALGMISRRTMPLSAAGIVVLFVIALWKYGAFHLADYPVFLGVAAYLALTGLQKNLFGWRPIDVVRWSAGITLMWASIEKWAYPEWSYPLFITHPNLTMGFEPDFFMRAAGAIEFALAFALLWSPLVRRVAAIMLTAMFVSAVIEFGKVDLIGHTLIVVVLLGILADPGGKPVSIRQQYLLPAAYAGALAAFLAVYYGAHALLFGTSIA
jgi:hypothetical protein